MSRKLAFILVFLLSLSSLLFVRFNMVEVKAPNGYRVHNLNTSLNYTTIQEAIDANETRDGHTIFVENGVYFEHILVNKSISLIGESRESTVINGSNVGIVVTIEANHTAIKNFMICNSGTNLGDFGIYLSFIQDAKIEKNVITNTSGIYEIFSDGIAFNENVMNYDWYALHLMDSSNNNITANVMENNHYGISIDGCNGNILSNNTMKNNVYNFGILGHSLQDFIHYIDTTNTINGRFIYYILNKKNAVIDPSTFPNVGYVGIVNSTYIKVNHWNLSNNWCTLLLASVNDSTITNVNITDNFHGIQLIASNNNTIENSRLAGNVYGLEQTTSNNNTVIGNRFTENIDSIHLSSSNGNTFIENTIENSSYRGISLDYSRNNMIHHNNFIRNAIQVSPSNSIPNDWDDGLEGNYWSEYTGTDYNQGSGQNISGSDGIGDARYRVNSNPQTPPQLVQFDNYPLMGPFSDFNATLEHHVQTICNSTISDFQFNGTAIMFNVTGVEGTVGFCRICIPTSLMNATYRVFVNGTEVTSNLLQCSNSTHSYLYFNYTHSTQEVIIIPEFPSFLIMPLIFTATLLATVIYRRKHARRERID